MSATTYDPEITARLIAEAKEDDARMTDAPWTASDRPAVFKTVPYEANVSRWYNVTSESITIEDAVGIARTRNNLAAMAEQLEAARAHIEYLETIARAFVEQRKSLDAARVDASRVPGLTASLDEARWERDVVLKREPAAGQAPAEIARLRADLETATSARARISARLGLPATATQSEIADRVDEVVGERDAMRGLAGHYELCARAYARIRELDEVLLEHSGNADEVGIKAEHELVSLVGELRGYAEKIRAATGGGDDSDQR